MGAQPTQTALKRWQRGIYGIPYLGYSIATIPVVAFIPAFYESERGLSLAAVGLMIALTRLTDAVTDPLVGWVSDRLRTPIGRRKPVILVGLPLLCLSVWMLFVPPDNVDLSYVFIWAALLYFAFTLVDLPFKAFGAELSPYYDERAELAGWREGLGLLGTMIGLMAAAYVALSGEGGLGDQLFIMAVIAIISTPLLFTLTLCLLREPAPADDAANDLSAFSKLRLIWRNGPFRSLLLVSFVLLAAEFGASALKALVFEHIFLKPDLFPVLLLAELVVMVLSIPFWLWLSRCICCNLGRHYQPYDPCIRRRVAVRVFRSVPPESHINWRCHRADQWHGSGCYRYRCRAHRGGTHGRLFRPVGHGE